MVLAVPRWQNWAGNQAATPRRVITPHSAEEVAEAVTQAAQDGLTVRMTGAGH
jgi:FAD/FMN-containing dehydrogenase